jgi:hypothetical protein
LRVCWANMIRPYVGIADALTFFGSIWGLNFLSKYDFNLMI